MMKRLRSQVLKTESVALELMDSSKSLRKSAKPANVMEEATSSSTCHHFHDQDEIVLFRRHLLDWYDQNKRELPWRTVACKEKDINVRTYAVWVSEIMLQQTQVATVIDYYNKWMKRWPTVQDLAGASLEVIAEKGRAHLIREVNQMWAGLGYYSRGKRLHEGAQRVVSQLNGEMPKTVETLQKLLPGVGRYTAGAVGSIALGQVTGVVDGNVIRVLCRVRAIGAYTTSAAVQEALWTIANTLVDPEKPGDFNQSMMELGAQVCTPKGPLCDQCPIQFHCHSYLKSEIDKLPCTQAEETPKPHIRNQRRHQVQVKEKKTSKRLLGNFNRVPTLLNDIEDCMLSGTCNLCPSEPWDRELGVQNFPKKPLKKAPRVENTLTCVVARPGEDGKDSYLITQRPGKGLLAGMWEFPSLLLDGGVTPIIKQKATLCAEMKRMFGIHLNKEHLQHVGEVVHIFSHIHQTYTVYSARLEKDGEGTEAVSDTTRWIAGLALKEAAVSTAVKKIMKLYDAVVVEKGQTVKEGKKRKASSVKRLKLGSENGRI